MEQVLISKKQKKSHRLGDRIKSSKYLILMIIPAIIFYVIFSYLPMIGILSAFQLYSPKAGIIGSQWIGLKHFKTLFADPGFATAFTNTLYIGTVKVILAFVSAILIAVLINEIRFKFFKKSVQTIVTFPHFLSWIVVAGLVVLIFNDAGFINSIIKACGGSAAPFLTNKTFFTGLIFFSDVWKEAGWASIIYIATMAGISPELYEAADMDGATRLQKIWHVTLPGIKPTAVLLLIMSVGGVFSAGFDQILNMSNDVVIEYVDILDTYIYRKAFTSQTYVNSGFTTAVGLFKSVISFALVMIVDRIAKLTGERGII